MNKLIIIDTAQPLPSLEHRPNSAWGNALPWLVICVGVALRLAVAAISIGSNDATTFYRFTTEIRHIGLLRMYGADFDFNHPPLPALWAAFCRDLCGENVHRFTILFKLAPIAADGASIYLLWKIWNFASGRGATILALIAAASFALSLDSVLITAFHCNTDSCYAMLCLLCVYLIERYGRFFWGGLALAAAINVKLIPILLIPPLLVTCRDWRAAWRFLLGLSLGVIPFIPPLWWNWAEFFHNVVGYGSVIDRWGIQYFLMGWRKRSFDFSNTGGNVALNYINYGRALIPIVVIFLSLIARHLKRWNPYQLCAVTFAIFMILTPGFGAQYTAIIGPILFAAAPGWGMAYACASGVFIGAIYYSFWDGKFPIYANYTDQISIGAGTVGLIAWIVLIGFVVSVIARRSHAAYQL